MSQDFSSIRSYEPVLEEFRRNYHGALATGKDVSLASFFDHYRRMSPLLHKGLSEAKVDVSVLKYCLDRLPEAIHQAERVVLAQSKEELAKEGIKIDQTWQQVRTRSRRRWTYFNLTTKTLVFLIVSEADIDDLVNLMVAYKLEWIKVYYALNNRHKKLVAEEKYSLLNLEEEDWVKLKTSLGRNWQQIITANGQGVSDLFIRLVNYRWIDSRRIAQDWWQKASQNFLVYDLAHMPIYFISSNFHSLVNIIGGYVGQNQNEIFLYMEENYPQLADEWQKIKDEADILRVNDFLYYFSKHYFNDLPGKLTEKDKLEEGLGIKKFFLESNLSGRIQAIPVSAIAESKFLDPYLKVKDKLKLAKSRARIINVDYPLGFGAYFMLSEVLENLSSIRGIYIVGKAAILSGEVGDLQVPKVVFDETTGNVYFFNNVFNEFFPFDAFQSGVLQNQKAISVHGTFLETARQMENYTRAGFNIIEMESGPFLTAMAEVELRTHYPEQKVIQFANLPFEIGIINYASDNPLSENTLGAGSLALKGIESTYLAALTLVQRIINLEEAL